MSVRKLVTIVEDVRLEGGRPVARPYRAAVAVAVVANPFAGRFVEDLSPLVDQYSAELGELLSERVVAALDVAGDEIEAFGKGALVGTAGEVEHASAIIHTLLFGNPFRKRCGDATTLLPACEKRGLPGATWDIPLKHVHDASTRSHHQTLEVRIADAPQADEIAVAMAAAIAGRPQQRLAAFGSELDS